MRLIEKSPWPTLTLIVSLEAIFLSTFVTIGQDRQTAFHQTNADHDYDHDHDCENICKLLQENTELTGPGPSVDEGPAPARSRQLIGHGTVLDQGGARAAPAGLRYQNPTRRRMRMTWIRPGFSWWISRIFPTTLCCP